MKFAASAETTIDFEENKLYIQKLTNNEIIKIQNIVNNIDKLPDSYKYNLCEALFYITQDGKILINDIYQHTHTKVYDRLALSIDKSADINHDNKLTFREYGNYLLTSMIFKILK